MSCWVYILKCSDQTLYSGSTTDLKRRIKEHNEGKGAKYTRSRTPVTLMQAWQVVSWSQALRLEAGLKKCPRAFKKVLVKDPQRIEMWAEQMGYDFPIKSIKHIPEGEQDMPIVQIDLLEGRTYEQKKAMVEKITEVLMETVGAKRESISIIIRDMPKENYAHAGQLASERK